MGGEYPRGQSYKANFGIRYIKNGFNKLNFTLNYNNFDIIYTRIGPLLKDSWRQNSILWADQLSDLTIAYITLVNVM